jgi:hypothetical protein
MHYLVYITDIYDLTMYKHNPELITFLNPNANPFQLPRILTLP